MQMTHTEKQRYQLRKQPKQARARATVQAVLDAAAQILVTRSYSDASTNVIAERAGVSIGSLYEYFPGKEAIFAELRRREGIKHYRSITREPRPSNPRDMLRHLVTQHVQFVSSNLALYVALETEVPRFAIAEQEMAVLADYVPQSNAFLQTHREQLRPHNNIAFITELLMRVVTATVNDYALRAPEYLRSEELTESLIDLLSRYLLNEAA
ncbi:MAG: TetR/AcrR family transcriptional regulator [Pseudomonadota bacterium]